MVQQVLHLSPALKEFIHSLDLNSIPESRKSKLQRLIDYGCEQIAANDRIKFNFICTHNSRRSQMAQIWAQTFAYFLGLPINAYSGGVEVTRVNPSAIAALQRAGFEVTKNGGDNPIYYISFANDQAPIQAFSKLYDINIGQAENFAAVMTCSDADEQCPWIPGAEQRIALNYEDPKAYDETSWEEVKYDECNRKIATELFYAFKAIQKSM